MKEKVGILSLGCPRNLVDSENFIARLNLKGYPIVDINKADIAVVNTCCFIDEAKRESLDAILDLIALKKKGKLKKVIVYGCLAQRYKDTLRKELPEVDAFVGTPSLNHSPGRFPLTPRHYAYLKVCESCINQCSFCIIPGIKGKFSSLEINSVLKRAGALDKEKISELNIIGQDISAYGMDLYGTRMLTQLLSKIIKSAKNIGWFRLLYLYPDSVIGPLVGLMKEEPRICRYIDLPIQHINDRLLKLMRRRTGRKEIITLIRKIRKELPDAAIRTSLITGFPSETEAEFKELLEFIQEAKFERMGVFIYSQEEGTPAYSLPGQIPHSEKVRRFNALMSAQQKVSRENNEKLLGRVLDVLIDEEAEGSYLGRTQYDAPEVDGLVYVNSQKKLAAGDFVKVRITDTLEYDLVGEAKA
ncbi:MAG: MiaB/RimO family radical SAM methylthiotransferase [Candidatus Omnitrophota bacterium]|jgi:ribosomal protein S12 methylthiotransferase